VAGPGFNKPRIIGIVAERLPQLGDGGSEALAKIDEGIFRPEALPDLLAVYGLARVLKQQQQELKRLILQLDSMAMTEKLPRLF
jgi:hypothetical protein